MQFFTFCLVSQCALISSCQAAYDKALNYRHGLLSGFFVRRLIRMSDLVLQRADNDVKSAAAALNIVRQVCEKELAARTSLISAFAKKEEASAKKEEASANQIQLETDIKRKKEKL